MPEYIAATEVNYVVLTEEQFANDFPGQTSFNGPKLAITDNDGNLVLAVVADNKAMLAELFGDIGEYTKAEANPGPVQARVGASHTVVDS